MHTYLLIRTRDNTYGDPHTWVRKGHNTWGMDRLSRYHSLEDVSIIEWRDAEDFPIDTPFTRARNNRLAEVVSLQLTRREVESILNGLFWASNEGQGNKGDNELRAKLEAL